jgi:hypothetical protein
LRKGGDFKNSKSFESHQIEKRRRFVTFVTFVTATLVNLQIQCTCKLPLIRV